MTRTRAPIPATSWRAAAADRIQHAIEQLTRPVRVVERYHVERRGPHLAEHDAVPTVVSKRKAGRPQRTHVIELPDLLEQTRQATERQVTGEASSSGGSFESTVPIDLDPLDVSDRIRAEAIELAEAATDRHFGAERRRLRSQVSEASAHRSRHRRVYDRRRAALDRDAALPIRTPVTAELLEVLGAHLRNLAMRALEAKRAAEAWRVELDRLQAELAIAATARPALLALSVAAGQPSTSGELLDRIDKAAARWLDLAQVTSRFEPAPVQVSEPCPLCRTPNALIMRGDKETSRVRCRECGEQFTHDQVGVLTRMIESNRESETLAATEATSKTDATLDLIERGRLELRWSKATLADHADLSRVWVSQLLNRRVPASPKALDRLVRTIEAALPPAPVPEPDPTPPVGTRRRRRRRREGG